MSNTETLAFEIGVEEVPAFDLKNATTQLEKMVPEALDGLGIPHGEVRIYSAPRRLITMVDAVATQTEAIDEVFRGPSAKIAFDAEGNPTKAAIGFAKGKGLGVEDLERRNVDGTEYVFATRHVAAQDVAALLPDVLRGLIVGLAWPRSMRWNTHREVFVRPIRWIVALLGETVVPVEYATVKADKYTYGHRVLAPGKHYVENADALLGVVEAAYVVKSQEEREAVIREGVARAEAATGYTAELPAKTLTEVINLAEYPTVMVGTFSEEFLKVPEEIIVDAMLMHQRYFPLYDANHKLTNKFIVVSNGDPACEAAIIDGNERVVAARLYDAKFFYEEDLKKPLESFVANLDEVVFQEKLGTLRAKTERVTALAGRIAAAAGLEGQDAADAKRAAYLAKADLATNAVIEFTSVQGVMGSYYAKASGETDQVAQAIAEHYRPRFSGDEPPATAVGQVVAMADKLDTICGMFAVDQLPTGTSDPFALRRSAIGIVSILGKLGGVSLVQAIDDALDILDAAGIAFDKAAVKATVEDFFITRTKVMLKDAGNGLDAIDAVMAVDVREPMELTARVQALETARQQQPEDFADLATAYARANNLRKPELGTDADESLMQPAEKALQGAIAQAEGAVASALQADDFTAALTALAALRGPIDTFFEDVMVMDEDPALRDMRLKLLNAFVSVFVNVADFSKLVKSGK
ncbi:MAG: glycine--tRNA ligase subunit beta [Coriobacteriia bacterium]|nr:glycine--tRNA ligase subunit beta [Coriobacteriia bacterium]